MEPEYMQYTYSNYIMKRLKEKYRKFIFYVAYFKILSLTWGMDTKTYYPYHRFKSFKRWLNRIYFVDHFVHEGHTFLVIFFRDGSSYPFETFSERSIYDLFEYMENRFIKK